MNDDGKELVLRSRLEGKKAETSFPVFTHGVYAQFYRADLAAFQALQAYRSFNNTSPIHLVSDGGDDLRPLATYFRCNYVHEKINNGTARTRRRATNQYVWLERIRRACNSSLRDVSWIILLEPDVECYGAPHILPQYALCGPSPGPAWRTALQTLFIQRFGDLTHTPNLGHYYTGCGGSIFNREIFLKCFAATPFEVFEIVSKFDNRIMTAEDATLSFLFQINGYETGGWHEFASWGNAQGKAATFVHGNKQGYGEPMPQIPAEGDLFEI